MMDDPISEQMEQRIDKLVNARMERFEREYLDELLTAAEVQKILKSGGRHPYNLAQSGQLPSINIATNGGRPMLRFKRGDVIRFLQSNYRRG